VALKDRKELETLSLIYGLLHHCGDAQLFKRSGKFGCELTFDFMSSQTEEKKYLKKKAGFSSYNSEES
ncbi:hypothetical protein AVEN_232352-1, partial [Araneus ventricosus]